MKKTIAIFTSTLSLLIAEAAPARPPWLGDAMAPGELVERRVDWMADMLDLTPEQQEQVRAILEARRAERERQRAAVRAEIDAVLTPEQRAERDAQMESRIERHLARVSDQLELTSEQESALKSVMIEKRDNPSLSPTEMRSRLASVLTEEQLAEFDALRLQRGPRGRGGFGRGGFGEGFDR